MANDSICCCRHSGCDSCRLSSGPQSLCCLQCCCTTRLTVGGSHLRMRTEIMPAKTPERTSNVVMLATCGVMRTRGWSQRREDGGSGSVANTSRSAKPTWRMQKRHGAWAANNCRRRWAQHMWQQEESCQQTLKNVLMVMRGECASQTRHQCGAAWRGTACCTHQHTHTPTETHTITLMQHTHTNTNTTHLSLVQCCQQVPLNHMPASAPIDQRCTGLHPG